MSGLAGLGCTEHALPVTEEAVTIYQELAQRHPERFRSAYESLAGKLIGLKIEASKQSELQDSKPEPTD